MKALSESRLFAIARRFIGEGLRLQRFYLATATILLIGFLSFLSSTWFEVKHQVEIELRHVDSLFGQAIESVFQHHESILRILGQRFLDIDAASHPERGRGLVDELMLVNPSMAGFGLARPNGQLLLVSGVPAGKALPNLLRQSASTATFLQVFDTDRLVIGRTYYLPLLQRWLIPIRIAVKNDQGFVKLVMTAGLDIDAPSAMWNAIELPENMQITLLRQDGFVQLSLPVTAGNRVARYEDPVPDDIYHSVLQPLAQDPFYPDRMAVTSTLLDGSMKTFVSYPGSYLWGRFIHRLVMPALLFAAAFLLTWILFRSVSRNQRAYEARLLHQAHHDALTMLPNRLLLADRLKIDLMRARRVGRHVALFYMDLDRFKRINDSYGHQLGDVLLRACADRLKESLRSGDTVGRLGGDEFLLIFPDLHTVDEVEILALRVLRSFGMPFLLEGREIFSSASIGVAVSPQDGEDADTLLQNADAALLKAKSEGRNNYFFYRQELNKEAARRLQIDTELRQALMQQEFHLVYQPQVDVASGRWRSVEALIRWDSALLGPVSPGEFIPIAEESGLIAEIGEFVLRDAMRDLKRVHQIAPALAVAVNTSIRQFRQEGFLSRILSLSKAEGFSPALLELEVTESVLADGAERFTRIREAGIRLAVDDFGTGFSSLGYLKRIPVTSLKIDRTFIKDLDTDPSDKTLTKAIIAMAKEFGLETVAEGVETEQQMAFLKEQGCNLAQGYLLARPMTIDALMEALHSQVQNTG